MTRRRGLYLYAVVGTNPAASSAGAGVRHALAGDVLGVDDAPVHTIECDGLGAVVSEVDLQRLAAVVEGSAPDLLAGLAQRHHAVVLASMDAVDRVLPLRLGTVLTGQDAARQFLHQRVGELSAGLREVDGCHEWEIAIGHEDTVSDKGVPVPTAPGTESDVNVGTAYLLRRRDQLVASQRRREAQAETVAAVADAVRALAERVAAGRRSGGGVLFDESYLVRRETEDRFLATVDGYGDRLQERGLRLRLTGPWPPYSFVPATLRVVT